MAVGKVLLISRRTLKDHPDALAPFLQVIPVQMAVALSPEDAELAKALTPAVASFQHTTAIVADFLGDILVHEDGSIEPIPLAVEAPEEPKLIIEA